MKKQNIAIEAVFGCKAEDLSILDNVGYDLAEIIQKLMDAGAWPTLNNIIGAVFRRGVAELSQLVCDRVCQLEAIFNERPLEDDEECELDLLNSLIPEQDIGCLCDCADSVMYFKDHGHIYRVYLEEELKKVKSQMGFAIKKELPNQTAESKAYKPNASEFQDV